MLQEIVLQLKLTMDAPGGINFTSVVFALLNTVPGAQLGNNSSSNSVKS